MIVGIKIIQALKIGSDIQIRLVHKLIHFREIHAIFGFEKNTNDKQRIHLSELYVI